MKINIPFGNRQLQIILWGFDDRDHWGFGYGRWPRGETMKSVQRLGWGKFGFHGFVIGILEFRYWPQVNFEEEKQRNATIAGQRGGQT